MLAPQQLYFLVIMEAPDSAGVPWVPANICRYVASVIVTVSAVRPTFVVLLSVTIARPS